MVDWQGRTTNYTYDANSMLIKTQRPDGTIETRDYDKAGRLSYIIDKKEEKTINSYYYGYDAVGNIVSITSQPQNATQGKDVVYKMQATTSCNVKNLSKQ